eukprot:Opistho-1_new@36257
MVAHGVAAAAGVGLCAGAGVLAAGVAGAVHLDPPAGGLGRAASGRRPPACFGAAGAAAAARQRSHCLRAGRGAVCGAHAHWRGPQAVAALPGDGRRGGGLAVHGGQATAGLVSVHCGCGVGLRRGGLAGGAADVDLLFVGHPAVFCQLRAGAGGCLAFRPAPPSGLGALGRIRPGAGAGAVNVGNSAHDADSIALPSPERPPRRGSLRCQDASTKAAWLGCGRKCCQKRFTAAYCRLQTGHIAAPAAVYLRAIRSVETPRLHPVAGAQRFLCTPAPCGLLRYEQGNDHEPDGFFSNPCTLR